MKLRVILPTNILVEEEVSKVSIEALNGRHTLLENHVDFVSLLVPGLLTFMRDDGVEEFVAVDQGVIVKSGKNVGVSVRHAVVGGTLGDLQALVEAEFEYLDEQEKKAQAEVAKLEAGLVRKFMVQERI